MKFSLVPLSPTAIASAKLRLYATDGSPSGGSARLTSSSSWSESTITYRNAPTFSSTSQARLGTVTAGRFYEMDLTAAARTTSTLSFAIVSSHSDGAAYASREATSARRPHLVVTLR